jgi:molybdate transport system regulatory protein
MSAAGGIELTAGVTNDAIDELGLKPGAGASAVFKAYAVMVAAKASA